MVPVNMHKKFGNDPIIIRTDMDMTLFCAT